MITQPPKVFISHASEDKDRFVLEFATRLRGNWVDAWVDCWEIGPGDSLIDRIFEEGIGNADAVIVVLSSHSIDKPWVREELSVSKVRQIEDGIRLIPVVIDACSIPTALRNTCYVTIGDLDEYSAELTRIVERIHGLPQGPPLGEAPAYVRQTTSAVPGISEQEALVLRAVGDLAVATDTGLVLTAAVLQETSALDLSDDATVESLLILGGLDLVNLVQDMDRPGQTPGAVRLQLDGFYHYARAHRPDYEEELQRVVASIVNRGCRNLASISTDCGLAPALVRFILWELEAQQRLRLLSGAGGVLLVRDRDNPLLERMMQ